ncbi:gliding motility-associated C-terminal domain-containing protein, partial [Daejeonella sp.]|uniref:T9SS type B sorting domain-containing protein n=1 Tax=Daejeonella sp. TaxID=2805397 RepID=UPI003983B6B1
GLAAGTYNVTVTDANNCTSTASITIAQPAAAFALSSTKTDVLCFGTSTGAINLSVTGGTSPYTYAWTGGITTEDLAGLGAGTYNVTVTDANSCTTTASVIISQPESALALTNSKTDVLCFGTSTGSINLSSSGGTAPYTYAWTDGIFTEDLSNLSAGTYYATVTDAKGCTATTSITIKKPAALLALTFQKTDITCYGTLTGAINLSVSGGIAPYKYVWTGDKTVEDLSGLAAGEYNVYVTDANNCKVTASITIFQPTIALTISSIRSDILCFGSSTGLIDLKVTGGNAPYTYSWNNGKTTEDLANLVAGNYTVTVTDSKGCSAKSTIVISQPIAIEVTASKSNVSCNGANNGAISLNIKGGTAPFTYKWNTGQITKDLTGIPTGSYKVIVTDAGNCSVSAEVLITQPEPLKVILTVKNSGCLNSGGTVSSKITGGITPYKISWAGNSTLSASEINNVKAGIYEMTVTDALGCTISVKAEIKQSACAPLAQNDIFEVDQNKMLLGDVAPNDSNSQPDKLTFTKLTNPNNGKITFETDGKFTFIPDNGYAGNVEFSYQICNSSGGCDTAKVSINIKALVIVNLTPELSSVWEGRKTSVTARLTKPVSEDVTITVEYSGKAEKDRDYLVIDQYMSLKIPKGSLSTTEKMTFAALNDAFKEGDEDIILRIKTISNPNVSVGSGAVIIINDVYPPPPPTDEPQDEPINAEILPDALMSPNGDGNGNEAFKIQNIEFFPDNEVLIFNRWGNALFAIKNYNNSDRNFKGFANKGLLVSSDLPLSDGVYFYIVTTYQTAGLDRKKQVNKGYLILKR